ncbi:hypothetical protein C6H68_15130 [Photorhabdus luminescens]|nr:hypothetical protein C6H68_15130 [Photorhabdus luminescens]
MSLFFNYLKDSQNLKPIIISMLTTFVFSVPTTYLIMDNTVVKEKTSRIEALTNDRVFLSNRYKESQDRLEKQIESEDSRLEKRVTDIKYFYNGKIADMDFKYKQLMQERDFLTSQLAKYKYNEKLELNNRNNENISQLRKTLNTVERNINILYLNHSKLSSDYGYSHKECEKRKNDFYSNISSNLLKLRQN